MAPGARTRSWSPTFYIVVELMPFSLVRSARHLLSDSHGECKRIGQVGVTELMRAARLGMKQRPVLDGALKAGE